MIIHLACTPKSQKHIQPSTPSRERKRIDDAMMTKKKRLFGPGFNDGNNNDGDNDEEDDDGYAHPLPGALLQLLCLPESSCSWLHVIDSTWYLYPKLISSNISLYLCTIHLPYICISLSFPLLLFFYLYYICKYRNVSLSLSVSLCLSLSFWLYHSRYSTSTTDVMLCLFSLYIYQPIPFLLVSSAYGSRAFLFTGIPIFSHSRTRITHMRLDVVEQVTLGLHHHRHVQENLEQKNKVP